MEELVLKASKRALQKKFREPGFVPGIVYGYKLETTPVKFEELAIRRLFSSGSGSKVWIKLDDQPQQQGLIKEVQWHLTKDKLVHIDVQLASKQ